MAEEPRFSRRSLPAVLAALGLTAAGIDSAKADVEPIALQYLRDRGYDVRTRGATSEILDKSRRPAPISATPRLAELSLTRDWKEFHKIELKNHEKCQPFLVGTIGALKQIIILPQDGHTDIKRTGPHHGFIYDETLGLIGVLGSVPGGHVYQIDLRTGKEQKITGEQHLSRLSGLRFNDDGTLKNMPSANCQYIS